MDINDDDIDLVTTTPHELSPPPNRKLKRLKKSKPTPSSPQTLISDHSSPPYHTLPKTSHSTTPVGSPQLKNSEHSSHSPDLRHTPPELPPSTPSPGNSDSETLSGPEDSVTRGFDESGEDVLELGSEGEEDEVLISGFESLGAKRTLEFDIERERVGDDVEEMHGTDRKKKKAKGDVGFDAIPERMTQKERRARFEDLRAENQRLLRETANAAFKPAPLVQRPISSLLEKIRQRKLEISKKFISAREPVGDSDNFDYVRELDVDSDPEDLIVEEDNGSTLKKVASEENDVRHVRISDSLDALGNDESNETGDQLTRGNSLSRMTFNDESKPTFRPPIDDTKDLFTQFPTNDTHDEQSDEQPSSPLEENFAPSVLAMNLKFDSAPPDELSDEEDNDKENIEPASHDLADRSSSPGGDPVKAFMEEEAEEEDDSDNDLNRFQDDEEEDDEDAEELNAMIATDYKERPVDADMRNELHQKWLEQQDAAGTENLFQRLKYGSVLKEAGLLDEEEDDDGEEDRDSEHDIDDAASEDLAPKTIVKMNMKKAKQMIPQMFSDKDDLYISSDDEKTEEKLVAEHSEQKNESRATLVSPAEDENSRDVFDRIKKLNDLPDTRKKPKASAFLDTLLTLKNKNSSSKSSFLGRSSNASLPSLQRRTSKKAQSFIFERDDSNGRNAASVTEGPSEMMQREIQPKRSAASKVSYSQPTSSSQIRKPATKTEPRTSLFDILKRSSMPSDSSNIDNRSHDTQTPSIFMAFKLDKPIKNEGRA